MASDDVVGTTGAFGGELPVTGLIVDQQAALLAERCLEAGTAKCTFGTGAFLLAQLGEHAVRSAAGLTTSVAWRLARPHVVLRRRPGLHRRLGRALGHRAGSGVRPPTSSTRSPPPRATGCSASRRSPGSPRPGGMRGATASFTGMTLSSGRGHLVRALLEGIAAQVATLTALVAADLGRR